MWLWWLWLLLFCFAFPQQFYSKKIFEIFKLSFFGLNFAVKFWLWNYGWLIHDYDSSIIIIINADRRTFGWEEVENKIKMKNGWRQKRNYWITACCSFSPHAADHHHRINFQHLIANPIHHLQCCIAIFGTISKKNLLLNQKFNFNIKKKTNKKLFVLKNRMWGYFECA